jgi:ABC-2 type transport system permease protein
MIGALLFAAIIPSHRGKQLVIALVFLILGVLSATARENNVYTAVSATTSSAEIFKNLSSATSTSWLPSTHSAQAITSLIHGDSWVACRTLLEFAAILSVLWFILYRVFVGLYEQGLNRVQSGSPFFKIHSRSSQKIARLIFPFSTPTSRAIITKEYKVFSRDITHTIQLGMLLGITFVYLYNYRLLTAPTKMSEEALTIWNIFLLISNVALGSLVLTSICSRFVYPSVSMEGTAFWLVQSAPVSLRDVLTAKFKSWLTPISIIGGVIFISGAMALNADVPLVLASCATGIILCHGLVALGVGLGALFSQFEWEHSTQLSMSLGSFIFMLTSMLFLGVNLIPIGLMFGTYTLFPEDAHHPYFSTLVLAGGLCATYIINRLTSWWALSAGARALEPR